MIRLPVLTKMLSLETAAGDWFSKLSDREQQAYIDAHPRSKFGKMNQRQLNTHLSDQARKVADHHAKKATMFDKRFGKRYVNGEMTKKANYNGKMSGHHDEAAKSFADAARHYRAGRHKEAQLSLKRGMRHARNAQMTHVKMRASVIKSRGLSDDLPTIMAAVPSKPTKTKTASSASVPHEAWRKYLSQGGYPDSGLAAHFAVSSYKDRRHLSNEKRAGFINHGILSNVAPDHIALEVYGDRARGNAERGLQGLSFVPGHDRLAKHARAAHAVAEKMQALKVAHPELDLHGVMGAHVKSSDHGRVGGLSPSRFDYDAKMTPEQKRAGEKFKALAIEHQSHRKKAASVLNESLLPHLQRVRPKS